MALFYLAFSIFGLQHPVGKKACTAVLPSSA